MKDTAGRIREELYDIGVLTRIDGHCPGLLYDAIDERHASLDLNTFDLAPILVVLLDRYGNARISRKILAMARVGCGKKIKMEIFAGKKNRRRPRQIAVASRQSHRVV